MNVLDDVQMALTLAPQVVQLFLTLTKLFGGDKNKAQATTLAATMHPGLSAGAKDLLTSAVAQVHQVTA